MNTKLYRATFNHGAVEETFYALDDAHASAVAHESAARRKLLFDAVQLVALKLPNDGRPVRGRIFKRP